MTASQERAFESTRHCERRSRAAIQLRRLNRHGGFAPRETGFK
jgi:hypothetical protein